MTAQRYSTAFPSAGSPAIQVSLLWHNCDQSRQKRKIHWQIRRLALTVGNLNLGTGRRRASYLLPPLPAIRVVLSKIRMSPVILIERYKRHVSGRLFCSLPSIHQSTGANAENLLAKSGPTGHGERSEKTVKVYRRNSAIVWKKSGICHSLQNEKVRAARRKEKHKSLERYM